MAWSKLTIRIRFFLHVDCRKFSYTRYVSLSNREKDDIEKAIMKARERANDDGESVGPEGDNLDGKIICSSQCFEIILMSIKILI